jgi:large subunit ribosomal protein L32e
MEEAIKIRKEKKDKKPTFTRSDSHKKVRIGTKWRRPRGYQSKVRLEKRGYVRKPKVGWGSPKEAYGLSREGLKPVYISNPEEIKDISDKEGILISGGVGKRKRVAILTKAIEAKITILNIKDPQGYIKTVEDELKKKKEEKTKKEKDREKKKAEKEDKAKKKEKKAKDESEGPKDELSEKIEEVEKKKKQKQEKDKILIKKDSALK